MKLSAKTLEILNTTTLVLVKHGDAIAERMYEILFKDYPQLEQLFEDSDGDQHVKLARTLSAFVSNIDAILDNHDMFVEAIEIIANKHVKKQVQKEHYPMVGVSILKAIKDILGDAATVEVMSAWEEAYLLFADVLMERESELYKMKS